MPKPKKISRVHHRTEENCTEVIIETPRGSRNKYKYEPRTGSMRLSKVMPEGMMFPYDFGLSPGTKGEDGDPLVVLVLTDEPVVPGCVVDCKLIGIIEAEQTEKGETKRNDRLIAVAQQSVLYEEVQEIGNLNATVLRQIEAFFVNYQKVRAIDYKIVSHAGPRRAIEVVNQARHKQAA